MKYNIKCVFGSWLQNEIIQSYISCYCFCNFRVLGWKRILKNCILMHQKTVTCNFKNDESNKEKIVNASGVSWHQSWTKKNQFQLTNWLNLQLSTLPAKKLHCIAGLSKLNLNDFSLITYHQIITFFHFSNRKLYGWRSLQIFHFVS